MCDNKSKSKKPKDIKVDQNLVKVTQNLNELKLGKNSPELNMCESFDLFKDLSNYFQYIDDKYFNGKLTKNGVQVKWSNRMTVNTAQTHPPKDGKPIEICLSRKLLVSRPGVIVGRELRQEMQKAYEMITKQVKTKDSKRIEKREITDESKAVKTLPKTTKMSSKSLENLSKCSELVSEAQLRAIEMHSIVDKRLQILDPFPDIQRLFKDYDKRFFDGILNACEVEISWSDTMQSCSGVTDDEDDTKPIRILISRKKLKFAPREELVGTILHEMIHAYTFLFDLDGDREHGPEFRRIMKFLERKTGAKIGIVHDYSDFGSDEYLEVWEERRRIRDRNIEKIEKLKLNDRLFK